MQLQILKAVTLCTCNSAVRQDCNLNLCRVALKDVNNMYSYSINADKFLTSSLSSPCSFGGFRHNDGNEDVRNLHV